MESLDGGTTKSQWDIYDRYALYLVFDLQVAITLFRWIRHEQPLGCSYSCFGSPSRIPDSEKMQMFRKDTESFRAHSGRPSVFVILLQCRQGNNQLDVRPLLSIRSIGSPIQLTQGYWSVRQGPTRFPLTKYDGTLDFDTSCLLGLNVVLDRSAQNS